MIAFHVDMNIAQFTREYLEKWLRELAELGYDTVVWEVENNIMWETCPECVSPDAFSKDEFREILDLSRELGLEPMPLFQTIAHAEYVLKHDKYKPLAETAGRIDQYCPSNPALLPFLRKWIDEYLDVFGEVKYFHLGADEAWSLGSCPKCSAYVEENSLSDLYIRHINALSEPLVNLGITPVIWADMALHHNEALEKLSRDIMLFDWLYERRRGTGGIWVWGSGRVKNDSIPAEVLDKFGQYLFPHGDEPAREPEAFYTADFLVSEGFSVVVCPSASSYGDNVFSPRNYFHLKNTYDSCLKGFEEGLAGACLTSWSVHLFPWELQAACIDMPPYLSEHPDRSMKRFLDDFAGNRFGSEEGDFHLACGLLSKSCLFSYTDSLGFNKAALPAPADYVKKRIEEASREGRLDEELANSKARLEEYRKALALLEAFGGSISKGEGLLGVWVLAARNLVNRAESSVALLSAAKGERPRVEQILDDLRKLRTETDTFYAGVIKPTRRREMLDWMYASVEKALSELA